MPAACNGKTILLGEDDAEIRNYLELALKSRGYAVLAARNGEEVVSMFEESGGGVAAVLLDLIMPRKDGMEALRAIRRMDERVPVIIVSAASSPVNVVEAMKQGATNFVGKPLDPEELWALLEGAAPPECPRDTRRSRGDARGVFIGRSPRMREISALVERIGWSEAPVMIQGETGAGKEVLARELHAHSPRAGRPFLKLNCAALPSELVESELFGYERGAFTGAFQRKPGMFEVADQGTLLLDEIGDMDVRLQAKLLQVLQDHEFQRLGGKETIAVDVRVIAATHRDLGRSIAEGTFRADLYYRLNVIELSLPPLRERSEDIAALARFLLEKHTPAGKNAPPITPELEEALQRHAWPGNIRELENMMRRLTILQDPAVIAAELRASNMPLRCATVRDAGADSILEQVNQAKRQAEAEAILTALNSTRWNRKKTAALLRIEYKALLYKMRTLGIDAKSVSMPPAVPGDEGADTERGTLPHANAA